MHAKTEASLDQDLHAGSQPIGIVQIPDHIVRPHSQLYPWECERLRCPDHDDPKPQLGLECE